MIKLGQKVKDSLTGFTGIVVSATEYLYGCRRLEVQPDKLNKDNTVAGSRWIDEPQLTLVGKKIHGNKPVAYDPGGGDNPPAIKNPPSR